MRILSKEEMRDIYNKTKSYAETGKILHCSRQRVWQTMHPDYHPPSYYKRAGKALSVIRQLDTTTDEQFTIERDVGTYKLKVRCDKCGYAWTIELKRGLLTPCNIKCPRCNSYSGN